MAFSLFGKKDDPPAKKPETKKADPVSAAPSSPPPKPDIANKTDKVETAPPREADADDDLSLDFTSFIPLPLSVAEDLRTSQAVEAPVQPTPAPATSAATPKPAASVPPARAATPAAEPASKPASKPPPATAPKMVAPAAGATKPAVVATPKPAPVAASGVVPVAKAAPESKPLPVAPSAAKPPVQRKPLPPDSVMSIEVTSASDGPAVVEEAAILFANAQDQSALAVLLKAVRDEDNSKAARQVWLMLFDMHQHLGMKKEHEELALEFAAKFERSPPSWIERQAKAVAAMLNTGGSSYVAFGDTLDARIAVQIDQARKIAAKSPALRFELSKLASVDATGCRLLLQCLHQLKRDGKSVVLTGEAKIIALLVAQAAAGDKAADQAFWLLLLEVYQMLGLHDAYEEAALNFAITYELSPPAWEQAAPVPATRESARAVHQAVPVEQVMRLTGDITGGDGGTLKAIVDYAAGINPVVIDFSAVPRVDFVNAGQLLNTFSKLHKAGKTVKIRGANELIVALFGVMGVQAVTGIEPKR